MLLQNAIHSKVSHRVDQNDISFGEHSWVSTYWDMNKFIFNLDFISLAIVSYSIEPLINILLRMLRMCKNLSHHSIFYVVAAGLNGVSCHVYHVIHSHHTNIVLTEEEVMNTLSIYSVSTRLWFILSDIPLNNISRYKR